MKRMQMPVAPNPTPPPPPPPSSSSSSSCAHLGNNSTMPDLLWISKQQQQHPSTYAHPLRNTIRVSTNGIRHKFDGKQWRPLCESPDGYECRNLVFRSSLCQKHFYKLQHFKRPYIKSGSMPTPLSGILPGPLKRPSSDSFEHHHMHSNLDHRPPAHQLAHEQHSISNEHEDIDKDDDCIQVLEKSESTLSRGNNIGSKASHQTEFGYFSIDNDQHLDLDTSDIGHIKSEPIPKRKRLDSTNNHSIISNDSDNSSVNVTVPKVLESIRLGLPPLTRTEEKALANELITQLSADVCFTMAEQTARRRACDIVMDNYCHQLSFTSISPEWFYDFLLRNPRVPIHFQSWFSAMKATLPSTDQMIDIKMWELGLVTRSIVPSSSLSTSSSSP